MTRGVFVAGANSSAAELNDVTDPPRCRVRWAGAPQSPATAVSTAVTFDTEVYDVGGMHDNAVNNTRITCPVGGQGLYTMGAGLEIATSGTGRRELSIRLNGTTYLCTIRIPPTAADPTRLLVATEYRLTPGDYIEAMIFQSSGAGLAITVTDAYTPFFFARWVAV